MSQLISLKGSTRTVTEFFEYSINSILYQRGVYPAEDFVTVKKYDLTLLKTHDDELKDYIRKILLQVHRWLLGGKCNQLVLCIVDKDEGEVVERWSFNVQHISGNSNGQDDVVDLNTTQSQIRALIRQITSSVTFLPELTKEGGYTFTVLAYTDADAKVPLEWADSNSKEIPDGEVVQFKTFSTNDHKVGAQVSYKY
ncbi:BAQ_1a_G0029380.mRNA.1.CDS.1 [Saccharomyces cerevisiae]|nr:BAQ_1a_G0029380.mRNA.1.CDS.1 [Saccharomyces cerevisiae]CAI4572206.1 BAM_G0029330.mRNA.1.CDS.1 [Saccharomyces cerevisiae]CAI7173636.1 BAM_G0029330.mRNA.1.CDS.1 [Saccharomyces cerevisiae]CAI7176145.1 BAQ_1a_G0029380.mRNA.1.CDS.1 [Saccharomyces cerevisiae]